MIDPTDTEKRCMELVLRPLGEIVAEIGMDKPLSQYTRAQILKLVEVVVGNYRTCLAESQPSHQDTGIPF